MMQERTDLDARVQNAVFGQPLLNPDEQHRCLGTFRERIELRITFAQALTHDFTAVLAPLLKAHPNYQLLLNGQLDMDVMGGYIRLANQFQVPFAIKTSKYYHAGADNAAVILCGDQALDRPQIDILERFPQAK